ncbi:hypothetical protein MTR72_15785 [Bradyrhizobium sp. ISRA442]|uniref:hypothetical protein n=1 Tax=Bradyrhizobium sp. ISRA442 TaxID=2866197 RepID=UPI00311AF229
MDRIIHDVHEIELKVDCIGGPTIGQKRDHRARCCVACRGPARAAREALSWTGATISKSSRPLDQEDPFQHTTTRQSCSSPQVITIETRDRDRPETLITIPMRTHSELLSKVCPILGLADLSLILSLSHQAATDRLAISAAAQ